MAHHVYHSAAYDRLEHTRGVIEAAERIIQSLERNAQRRLEYGPPEDKSIPTPTDFDRVSIRLAALLHDVGHGPFSHTTENLIGSRLRDDFVAVEQALRDAFPGATKIPIGERIAAVVVLSEPLRQVFEHPKFEAVNGATRLAPAIVARILGSPTLLNAPYLSGVISGPLDADKLDYMARDSYHAGLPVALDTNRLINKLEVVTVTPESVTIPSLRRRAEGSPERRYYDVGISLAGLGAYEQMIVGRVLLFDRLYYHHKIRASEAMVRKLIELAESERGRQFELRDLFYDISDDGMIDLISGRLRAEGFDGGKDRSRQLGQAIHDRNLYHRAFAVAKRFIGGLDGVPEQDREETRIYRWNKLLTALDNTETVRGIEEQIIAKAKDCIRLVPEFSGLPEPRSEDIVLDVPFNKVVVRGSDILTRTEDGHPEYAEPILRPRAVVERLQRAEAVRIRVHPASSGSRCVACGPNCVL
jgi:HD superfamily phosphohydrolase